MKHFLIVLLIIIAVTVAYNMYSSAPVEQFVDKPVLTLYYTTWCGYSRQFLPIWDDFAKQNKYTVRLVKMRCEGGNEATCNQKGIPGFPYVIFTDQNGKDTPFEGPRTVGGLNGFLAELLK